MKVSFHCVFRSALVSMAAIVLSACTSTSPIKVLAPPTYADLMVSADEAQRKGGIVESMGYLEQASKADPSKKQPWLRIAQAQFDSHNYGAAITAAQEVLQRDNADVTAKSIMAVSGLRVSANALEQLRQINAVNGNTREEAQTLARTMREALGEPILPATVPDPVSPSRQTAKIPARRALAQPASPASAPLSSPVTKPAVAPETKRNPFEALKG